MREPITRAQAARRPDDAPTTRRPSLPPVTALPQLRAILARSPASAAASLAGGSLDVQRLSKQQPGVFIIILPILALQLFTGLLSSPKVDQTAGTQAHRLLITRV